jgi:hypothetical protein
MDPALSAASARSDSGAQRNIWQKKMQDISENEKNLNKMVDTSP